MKISYIFILKKVHYFKFVGKIVQNYRHEWVNILVISSVVISREIHNMGGMFDAGFFYISHPNRLKTCRGT